jgi:hypothetical protein
MTSSARCPSDCPAPAPGFDGAPGADAGEEEVDPVSRAMTSSARRRISSGVGGSDTVPESVLTVLIASARFPSLTVGGPSGPCVSPGSVAYLL